MKIMSKARSTEVIPAKTVYLIKLMNWNLLSLDKLYCWNNTDNKIKLIMEKIKTCV